MGIRFKAAHLTCPACGAALTPLNRPDANHDQVTDQLAAQFATWDPEDIACEACVTWAFERSANAGLIDRIKGRFKSQETAHTLHRYRTTEII